LLGGAAAGRATFGHVTSVGVVQVVGPVVFIEFGGAIGPSVDWAKAGAAINASAAAPIASSSLRMSSAPRGSPDLRDLQANNASRRRWFAQKRRFY